MIEHYLGADAFRDGVRLYMQRHREANAVAADLWRALEEASGRDVARVAQAWIAQPGFPLVSAAGETAARLRVRQERFFADPRVPAARRRAALAACRWWSSGPGAGGDEVERFLVDKAHRSTVALGARRSPAVVLRQRRRRRLLPRAARRRDHAPRCSRRSRGVLTPVERLALVGDQWALVRAARAPIESFLDVADALGDETDHDVLDGARRRRSALLDEQVVEPASRAGSASARWIARRFGPAARRARLDGGAGRERRRAAPPRGAAAARRRRSPRRRACSPRRARRLDAYLARPQRARAEPRRPGGRDSRRASATRRSTSATARWWPSAAHAAGAAPLPPEPRLVPHPGDVERTLAALLDAEIPTQDVAFVLMRLLGNPGGARRGVALHHPALDARSASASRRSCCRAWSRRRRRCASRATRARCATFFRAHPLPEATRALQAGARGASA